MNDFIKYEYKFVQKVYGNDVKLKLNTKIIFYLNI